MPESGGGALRYGRLSPWLDVCVRPRETLRAILDEDPDRHATRLIVVPVVVVVIWSGFLAAASDKFPLWPMRGPLIGGLALILLFGWTALMSIMVAALGRRRGGVANWRQVRCALVWGHVPTLALPLTLLILGPLALNEQATLVENLSVGVCVLVALWIVCIQVAGIAAAHRVSLGRAAVAWLLGAWGVLLGLAVAVVAFRCAFERDFLQNQVARIFT